MSEIYQNYSTNLNQNNNFNIEQNINENNYNTCIDKSNNNFDPKIINIYDIKSNRDDISGLMSRNDYNISNDIESNDESNDD